MKLTCNYVHSGSIGYGRMGIRLVDALKRAGVEVQEGLDDGPTNVLCTMGTPPQARSWYEGQHNTILTMFETTRLPESFIEGIDNYDTVLVPSQQNVELFSELHPNVKLVLLGVDPTWTYRKRTEPDLYFTFLCGGSGPRKGVDLVTRAFNKVFGDYRGDGPIPRLIMKSPRGAEGFDVGPNIEVVAGKLTNQEELDLYASAHCYLQPSRGEGFGFQPLQAIAQGCPTILTDAHGHASFAHLGYGLSSSLVDAAYFSHGFAGQWWEPDFDELCERMEYVYENYDDAVAFAEQASAVAHAQFSWENSANMFIDAIGQDRLESPYTGSGEMLEAKLRKYKVVLNKPWTADIAGTKYHFEPGQVYYESADVLRILFDGGMLDPSCLDNKGGLTESQLERLGAYSASHSHCHACGNLINGGVAYRDYLMLQGEVERLRAQLGVSV